jgi:Ca2+-binding EF-hand superfamily protein
MVRWVAIAALVALVWAEAARAQDAGPGPSPLDEAMARNPDRVETMALDLIAGFGGAEGLTAQGIEAHIALERASARASALRRLLAADLDADGRVTRAELAVAQGAASAAMRGRMERQFTLADADGDGQVDAAELAADAQAAALRALDEDEAALMRALLGLDGDGDGALTGREVTLALAKRDEAT